MIEREREREREREKERERKIDRERERERERWSQVSHTRQTKSAIDRKTKGCVVRLGRDRDREIHTY